SLNIKGYNVLMLFGQIPEWVFISVKCIIDNEEKVILDRVKGINKTNEFKGEIKGKHLTSIKLEFGLREDKLSNIDIRWLGLSVSDREAGISSLSACYDREWDGLLKNKPSELKPNLGIFFDTAKLQDLKNKLKTDPLRQLFYRLKNKALKDLEIKPEAEIGKYIPRYDRRWCRIRDKKKTPLFGPMMRLAFVGIVEENLDMLRMSARMALSAAHCEYWCESFMGVFPGSVWHHRSFTEERYCRACALVLDWAGSVLTPGGKEVIRDAIIMKGLPRIESDFKRMEYIRDMNQGIVFSAGRIIGLMSLIQKYPRYKEILKRAEKSFHQMMDNYIREDGGILEGANYWNYTFSRAMPIYYCLAQYHDKSLKDYVPETIIKTGDFMPGMLSTIDDGMYSLPVNDARQRKVNSSVAAAFTRISANPIWEKLFSKIIYSEDINPDVFTLIMAPTKIPQPEKSLVETRFFEFPESGQFTVIRKTAATGYSLFHLCSGPNGGHYHEDKGSFILEADGEVLALDRGVTSYSNPETSLMKIAPRHNLLYPENPDGEIIHQPLDVPGAKLGPGLKEKDVIMIASDNKGAWEEGLFNMNIRRVFSPTPELFIFDDLIELNKRIRMSFRINTLYPVIIAKEQALIRGENTYLKVIPLNWKPEKNFSQVEGIDYKGNSVNLLIMKTKPNNKFRLITALQILPNNAETEAEWKFNGGEGKIKAKSNNTTLNLKIVDTSLKTEILKKKQRVFTASCKGIHWERKEGGN
ncbi:MAG: hypothetical protein ACOCV3_05960, partial [Halanaerobiales bacterium]